MTLQSLTTFNEPKTLTFYNPFDEKEKPLILKVYKQNTTKERTAFREMVAKTWELRKDENNIEEIDGTKNLKVELLEELGLEYLSKLVEDWDGMTDAQTKKKVPFSRELLVEAMKNFQPLAQAIDTFYKDISGKSQQMPAKTS